MEAIGEQEETAREAMIRIADALDRIADNLDEISALVQETRDGEQFISVDVTGTVRTQ